MAQHIKSITMRLKYKHGEMVIPINPESITVSRASASKTENVIGVGDISIPQTNSLATIEIASAFFRYWMDAHPETQQYRTTKEYADWFKTWQLSNFPAQWTVEELGYNLWVTCEAFDYTVKAGEEDDVYYSLSLQEYREYGAKVISIASAASEGAVAPPPEPPRIDASPPVPQTYTVVSGDNLSSIARRLSGSDANWQALYAENKVVIGNNPNLISPGMVLVVPTDWTVRSQSYVPPSSQVVSGGGGSTRDGDSAKAGTGSAATKDIVNHHGGSQKVKI